MRNFLPGEYYREGDVVRDAFDGLRYRAVGDLRAGNLPLRYVVADRPGVWEPLDEVASVSEDDLRRKAGRIARGAETVYGI